MPRLPQMTLEPDVTQQDQSIYLDHQATTPCAPQVIEAMLPWLSRPANPHALHAWGRLAAEAVHGAACDVAALIGAEPDEIVFTSGATEANNLAIAGSMHAAGSGDIVTSRIEHMAVLDVCAAFSRTGSSVTYLEVDHEGIVDPLELSAALTPGTVIASIGTVNNEIGKIQPIAELAEACRAAGVLFHSDCAQAPGRTELDVSSTGVDLISLSAHKFYGPAGVGALFASRDVQLRLQPLLRGGGQQNGLRPGTVPVCLVVGFGRACRLAAERQEEDVRWTLLVRDTFLAVLRDRAVAFEINGGLGDRIAANLNLRFDDCDAELLMADCPEVLCSMGSACSSGDLAPSHVLLALGLTRGEAESSLRFGFGRDTTVQDAQRAGHLIAEATRRQTDGRTPGRSRRSLGVSG